MTVTESGEKSNVHWVPVLETEKNTVVVVVVERVNCSEFRNEMTSCCLKNEI